MALLQALLAALTRSAGKLLNTAFAWATVLLFGRVSQDRQIYVSVIPFGSVIWLVALVGVAFPAVGTFLLSFVPLPDWVDKKWVRLAMLSAVVVLPLGVGLVSVLMHDKDRRPHWAAATIKVVLKGYRYTIGLATTLTAIIILAPIIKIRALSKRWTSEHVPWSSGRPTTYTSSRRSSVRWPRAACRPRFVVRAGCSVCRRRS